MAQTAITKENTADSILAVTLPDQSIVRLSPHTKITYTAGFNRTHRNLALQGEAQFEVAKNAALPFRVAARGYYVTALGTIFRVNAHSTKKMHVQLLEGKIEVLAQHTAATAHNAHILTPGQALLINLENDHISKFEPAISSHQALHSPAGPAIAPAPTGHRAVVLHFNETPAATVIAQIEHLYGKRIHWGKDIAPSTTYSGRLPFHNGTLLDSLSQVVSFLFKNQRVTYQIENNQIIIKKTN